MTALQSPLLNTWRTLRKLLLTSTAVTRISQDHRVVRAPPKEGSTVTARCRVAAWCNTVQPIRRRQVSKRNLVSADWLSDARTPLPDKTCRIEDPLCSSLSYVLVNYPANKLVTALPVIRSEYTDHVHLSISCCPPRDNAAL
jgi:hypothetical protein